MTKRNAFMVFLLPIITLGIYSIYWHVVTKNEMNRAGASIPTAWLMIIPLVNIWWLWKFSEGIAITTNEEMTGPVAFLLLLILESIGAAIIQTSLNKVTN